MKHTILIGMMYALNVCAQQVHHQMISSQGSHVQATNGVVLKQTIGQQSVIGKHAGNQFIVGQGFLNSAIFSKKQTALPGIEVSCFPNPFSSNLNLQFPINFKGVVRVAIYDIKGGVVYEADSMVDNNLINIETLYLPDGAYVLKLQAENVNFTAHLIKLKSK